MDIHSTRESEAHLQGSQWSLRPSGTGVHHSCLFFTWCPPHSKEEDKGYWYIPPNLLPLWNQITVGCPPHFTWVNISCMENNVRGLAMQWMLHGQVMLQWGQPYILFMYFHLARLHFCRDCGHKWGDNLPFRCNLWKENLLHFLEFVRKWLCVNWRGICQAKCSLWRSFLTACILKNTTAHKWSG